MTRQWNWQILRAGSFRLDGGAMFGIIPRVLWEKQAPADEQHRIGLQTNCLLLRDGGDTVLIETGFGDKFAGKDRDIFALEDRWIGDALAEVGVSCEEITHVILTHLHFDHAGGTTRRGDDGAAVPTFPNARLHVQRTEWDDANANKSVMTRTYLPENLQPIQHQIELIEGEHHIAELGIRVFPVPGHTWGQQAVLFEGVNRSAGLEGRFVFPGDVMPTAAHAGPPYNMAYDVLPYQNMLTKADLLRRCRAGEITIIIDHEPGHPCVRVHESADRPGRYTLVPVGESIA